MCARTLFFVPGGDAFLPVETRLFPAEMRREWWWRCWEGGADVLKWRDCDGAFGKSLYLYRKKCGRPYDDIMKNVKTTNLISMKKNEDFVITINRELGSGGRTVGRLLAEKLGVPFYDKALIHELQKLFNLSADEIEHLKGREHSFWAEVERILKLGTGMNSNYFLPQRGDEPDSLTTDDVYKKETLILQSLSQRGSCVIAGRTGFHVLRDHPNHLSILIQASMPYRVERVMRKQNMTEKEARATIERVDKMRENYVNKYTKTSRYDTRNYQLVISADGKTEAEIVDLILQYI